MDDKWLPLYSVFSSLEIVWFSFLSLFMSPGFKDSEETGWSLLGCFLPWQVQWVGGGQGYGGGTGSTTLGSSGHSSGEGTTSVRHVVHSQPFQAPEAHSESSQQPSEAEALLCLVVQMLKPRPCEAIWSFS